MISKAHKTLFGPLQTVAALLTVLAFHAPLWSALRDRDSLPLLVHGLVTSPDGYSIPGVALRIRGTKISTTTNDLGLFELRGILPTAFERSNVEVWAVGDGFEPSAERCDLSSAPVELKLVLQPASPREDVTVEAQAPEDEISYKGAEAGFLDIVSTAGTNADVFYAAQMMPGVVKLDEGSGLFVRGGDVSETATYLDRALLDHPFRSETPTGGFFGAVDVFQLTGFSLSTGGFPARYGNVLSAVLELESRRIPPQPELQVNLGLATGSFQYSRPLGQGAGFRLAANRVLTRALVALNKPEFDFSQPPSSWDLNATFSQSLSRFGDLRIGFLKQASSVGTQLEEGNFDGFLDSLNRNQLLSLSWQKDLGWKGDLAVTLTSGLHKQRTEVDVLEIDGRERTQRLRFDFRREFSAATLRAGLEAERISHRSFGRLPRVGLDFAGVQGLQLWDQTTRQSRIGGYFELERGFGPWAVNLGLRADRYRLPDAVSLEPRFSLSYRLSANQQVRLATGLYRQRPAVEYLSPGFGNPSLGLMTARHWVLGYRYGDQEKRLHIRVEGYFKNYSRLPLQNAQTGFDDQGHGYAQGIDSYAAWKGASWKGWLSYSYLRTRRLYTPWQRREQFDTPIASYPPDFAVPHSLQLNFSRQLPSAIDLSSSFRVASGVPYTPVTGTRSAPGGAVPVYGPINSKRVPAYQRLDLSFSRPVGIFREALSLIYLGINDVLDRRSFFRFVYSEDFSQRRPARTSFGRTFYFGISFRK